jgi:periplasmic protein TonB
MTSKEIRYASLLDILFEGRNKEYGAYALRRGYNHRLLLALGAGLSVVLFFILINTLNKNDGQSPPVDPPRKESITITKIELPADLQPAGQPKPKPVPPKPVDAATVKYTTPLLVNDDLRRTEVPDISTLAINAIGSENRAGENYTGTAPDNPAVTGGGPGAVTGTIVAENPPGPSSHPEFPGGFAALKDFLSRNLYTPAQLEIGDKKIVKARFIVDKDGSVSGVEIEVSGGRAFDREVVRVCRKMPKWKPALQNGNPVAVSYILPVTFIGVEQ